MVIFPYVIFVAAFAAGGRHITAQRFECKRKIAEKAEKYLAIFYNGLQPICSG